MLAQILWLGEIISEVSCPTALREGIVVDQFSAELHLRTGLPEDGVTFRLARWGLLKSPLFPK